MAKEHCVNDIRRWMLTNRLMIKDGKTEVMLVVTPQQLAKITLDGIKVGGENIVPATAVRNLGMNQDSHLKMDKHVSSLCSWSFYQLCRLRRIRKFLTPQATQTLVHAFITSNSHYCNPLFYGMPQYLLDKLQRIQKAAARVVMLVPKFEHITPVMIELHWLPVKYRIMYKILLLIFKCLSGEAPTYLQEMIRWHVPRRTLRSSSALLLEVRRCKC